MHVHQHHPHMLALTTHTLTHACSHASVVALLASTIARYDLFFMQELQNTITGLLAAAAAALFCFGAVINACCVLGECGTNTGPALCILFNAVNAAAATTTGEHPSHPQLHSDVRRSVDCVMNAMYDVMYV